METQIYLWVHLLAFAAYTGSTLTIAVVSVPTARAKENPREALRSIAQAMRVYDPLSIGTLGLLVMTGAFNLTGYKAALRSAFFEQLGGVLAWKLCFAFLLIILASYIAFGIGHRLVRFADLDESVEEAWVGSMLRRLRVSAFVALLLVAVTVWIALAMTHGARFGAAGP